MVQYTADINDCIGKFPFQTVYNFDMKFHIKKQTKTSMPFTYIDNQLSSKCFLESTKNTTSVIQGKQIKMCNNFNQGRCYKSHCKFQKKCSKCYRSSHSESSSESVITDKQYKLVTPVNNSKLETLLKEHPNRQLVQYVVQGFRQGFHCITRDPTKADIIVIFIQPILINNF